MSQKDYDLLEEEAVADFAEELGLEIKKTSVAKSLVAQTKPRVGGRFVKINADDDGDKKADNGTKIKKRGRPPKNPTITKDELFYDTRVIPEEIKEYIGSDSRKFFEMALMNSRTWSEGYKYAKELKPLQHPSLSAQQIKQEVEVTKKILTWEWENSQNHTLLLEDNVDDSPENRDSVQTYASSSPDTQESEEI